MFSTAKNVESKPFQVFSMLYKSINQKIDTFMKDQTCDDQPTTSEAVNTLFLRICRCVRSQRKFSMTNTELGLTPF